MKKNQTKETSNKLQHVGFLLMNPIEFKDGFSLCFCSGRNPIYFKSTHISSCSYKEDYEFMLKKFDLMPIRTRYYDDWQNSNGYHRIIICKDGQQKIQLLHFFYFSKK